MPPFAHLWPWLGLGLAGALVAGLISGHPRGDRDAPRGRNMAWLAWAATAAYLIHQFEEHGLDARGAPYAFRGALCATLGYAAVGACPIPESFITAVNLPVAWLAGPVSAWLGRRRAAIALSYFSVPAVNAAAHIGPALVSGHYNPGLLTAVFLFLPLSLWTFWSAARRPDLGVQAVAATLAGGVAIHAVLLLSLKAYLAGRIGEPVLIALQVFNPFIPMLLVTAVTARRGTATREIPPPPPSA